MMYFSEPAINIKYQEFLQEGIAKFESRSTAQ